MIDDVLSSDVEDPEYAPTKQEWEELQLYFDVTLSNELKALSEEERVKMREAIKELDVEAIKESIRKLINKHPVEFELILSKEREKRDISDKVEPSQILKTIQQSNP